ncbi:MAG TPA: gluconokinase [Burkholderiales bacterium]|nr:gluconokinase [Burkholderiales bacterium]
MIVLVMGVSGSGKTTIGERLAARLGARFLDADDFHPPQNVAKMAAGVPLTDEDRSPWLTRLNEALRGERNAVLACSALKEKYRKTLREGVADFRIAHLKGSYDFIHARLAARRHRYMPASLLASQFATLEPPADAIEVDVTQDVDACVAKIAEALG